MTRQEQIQEAYRRATTGNAISNLPTIYHEFADGAGACGAVMSGTEWTEPGQGADLGQLATATTNDGQLNRNLTYRQRNETDGLLRLVAALQPKEIGYRYRTNLRLTGAPLTEDDLRRIAEAS